MNLVADLREQLAAADLRAREAKVLVTKLEGRENRRRQLGIEIGCPKCTEPTTYPLYQMMDMADEKPQKEYSTRQELEAQVGKLEEENAHQREQIAGLRAGAGLGGEHLRPSK